MVTPWKMSSRIGGRSRIEGAVPARKFEEQDTDKTTREGERLEGGPRGRPTGTRFREEKQADSVSPTCSREPMKGDTSVDPTERPNSKFMVPSQQPALVLVAPAIASEDPGRNFPKFPPAPPWRIKLLA